MALTVISLKVSAFSSILQTGPMVPCYVTPPVHPRLREAFRLPACFFRLKYLCMVHHTVKYSQDYSAPIVPPLKRQLEMKGPFSVDGSTTCLGCEPPTCKASIKALVPDLAIVPRLLTRSAFVIPIPVSISVRVRSWAFGMMSIFSSLPLSSFEGSVRLS